MIALARAWIALATLPLPAAERAERRAELVADCHDQLADGDPASAVLLRLLRGAPVDVVWSVERSVTLSHPVHAPAGLVLVAIPPALSLWLVAVAWHQTEGASAAVATVAYVAFWLLALALAAVLSISTLLRWRNR